MGVARAHRKCPLRILPFSVFRVALFNSPVASGHPLRRFELLSGRYPPEAGPGASGESGLPDSGIGRENGDRCGCRRHRLRVVSGGLQRPLSTASSSRPGGIHGGPPPRPPAKEDRMQANEHVPVSLDEVISEIATNPGPRLHAPPQRPPTRPRFGSPGGACDESRRI